MPLPNIKQLFEYSERNKIELDKIKLSLKSKQKHK